MIKKFTEKINFNLIKNIMGRPKKNKGKEADSGVNQTNPSEQEIIKNDSTEQASNLEKVEDVVIKDNNDAEITKSDISPEESKENLTENMSDKIIEKDNTEQTGNSKTLDDQDDCQDDCNAESIRGNVSNEEIQSEIEKKINSGKETSIEEMEALINNAPEVKVVKIEKPQAIIEKEEDDLVNYATSIENAINSTFQMRIRKAVPLSIIQEMVNNGLSIYEFELIQDGKQLQIKISNDCHYITIPEEGHFALE